MILIPCVLTAFIFSLITPMLSTMLNKRVPEEVRTEIFSLSIGGVFEES